MDILLRILQEFSDIFLEEHLGKAALEEHLGKAALYSNFLRRVNQETFSSN